MTSDQHEAAGRSSAAPARLLRRRSSDRVIGGVAAGIADYLNIDPLLIRAAFVGLMIFGGAGVVLYVGAWLLIPVEGRDDSILESALLSLGVPPGSWVIVVALVVAVLVWLTLPQQGYVGGYVPVGPTGFYVDSGVLIVVLAVVLGIALLRRGVGSPASATAASPAAYPTADAATAIPAVRPAHVRRPTRPRAPRGPLGWYTVGAALIGIGLLAVVDNATDARVTPGQFFGLALGIVGGGLVIGSWWGNARLLILPALLVLPIAWVASFITVPLEGGVGDQLFVPTGRAELRDEYRLMVGRLTLDLRELETGSEPIRMDATVAVGEVFVIVPRDARIDINSQVGAGASGILENWHGGTAVRDRYVRGETGPLFILDLGAGIGVVSVYQEGPVN